ncbi:unnamed protein product, partial [Rotaria sp. Silwood1]
MKGGR